MGRIGIFLSKDKDIVFLVECIKIHTRTLPIFGHILLLRIGAIHEAPKQLSFTFCLISF